MNKKYGFLFLGIGICLFILFVLYNYTDLFIKKEKNIDNKINSRVESKEYGFVKSYDVNSKTKIVFPLFSNLSVDQLYTSEYARKYYNEDDYQTYSVRIYESTVSLEEYINERYNDFSSTINENRKIITNDIKCPYMCKEYQLYDGDILYSSYFEIYIKTSPKDIAQITYFILNSKVSDEIINDLIENIKVTEDATYTIGKVEDNLLKLNFALENKKNVIVSLDSNTYEEIPQGGNESIRTTIKNKTTNSTSVLKIYTKEADKTIQESIDTYFNLSNPKISKETINIGDKTIYEYDIDGWCVYVTIINSDNALIIQPSEGTFDVNDFQNIIIKDI